MPALMSLARHIREQNWTALEDAWTDLILKNEGVESVLDALSIAAEKKELPRCLALVRDHAEMLANTGRAHLAAELLGTTMLHGGSPGELSKLLWRFASEAWGKESYFETFAKISDLRENAPDMRSSWRLFRKLLGLEPGRVLYHAKGWGLGVIESLDHETTEARVRFASGRTDRFPYQTAVEIFEVLERDDLRALVVLDQKELDRRLKQAPLEVLRWVLRRNNGRANLATIKLALNTIRVDGTRFTNWWKKARQEAETSEWFELSGPPAKVVVRLLDRAEDPVDGLRRQLRRSPNLAHALTRVRSVLAGGTASIEVKTAALATLGELAQNEAQALPERLAVWLFLREELGSTPEALAQMCARAAETPRPQDVALPQALWSLFQEVPTVREQERCIELLREVHGERWLDEASRELVHAAPGMARGIVDALLQAGRGSELVAHYVALLARPTKNPTVLVQLAERVEIDSFAGDLPPDLQRAQCLLQLATTLYRAKATETRLARARQRLVALLTEGEPALLTRLLAQADIDSFRNFATAIEGGIDREIDRLFTQIAIAKSPDIFRGEERPFWTMGGTWTTRKGMARREAELRELRDVKIPANAEAIGKAASFGDLSENSEWEAAIEEQRNLTNRAMEVESELRDAQLIENAAIPEGAVSPGTEVRYRELDTRKERWIKILGPWEPEEEGLVSYRSPLAKGMLGLRVGDQARIELPTGSVQVQVLGIGVLPLL